MYLAIVAMAINYLLILLPEAANGAREAHGAAAGTGVLGVESGVVREWVCELCRYRAEIFATGGDCAVWVEDAGDVLGLSGV